VVGFAFTELLGFRLLPRLRNLGAMGPVLTRPIRWDLIARQLYQCTQALVTSTVRRSSGPCTAMTPPGDDPEQRGVRRHVRVAGVVVIFARSVALLGGAVTALTLPVLGVVISVVGFVVLAAGAGLLFSGGVAAGWRPAGCR
jgi:hypothetical protein